MTNRFSRFSLLFSMMLLMSFFVISSVSMADDNDTVVYYDDDSIHSIYNVRRTRSSVPAATHWTCGQTISYRLANTTPNTTGEGAAIRAAMDIWEAAIDVEFESVSSGVSADLIIGWEQGTHGDSDHPEFDDEGTTNQDGTISNVLAHAGPTTSVYSSTADASFFSEGILHFDEYEEWTTDERSTSVAPYDLITVAAHEIGHVLGLFDHSDDSSALMASAYTGSHRFLSADDIDRVQTLYKDCDFSNDFSDEDSLQTSALEGFPATGLVRPKNQNSGQRWHIGSGENGDGYGYAITNQAYGTIKSAEFTVNTNQSFEFSVDVKGEIAADASKSSLSARVYYYSDVQGTQQISHWDSIASGAIQHPDDWETYTEMFTPPAGAKSARVLLIGYQFSGWVAFDNVSVYALTSNETRIDDNLIKNPGFEVEDASGNVEAWSTSKQDDFPATTIVRHNEKWHVAGGKSGYGYAITNQAYGNIKSNVFTVHPNYQVEFSVDVKGEIAADSSRSGLSARVYYYSDVLGTQQISHWDSIASGAIQHPDDWETYTEMFTPPAGAKSAQVVLFAYQFSGWVAFDNVSAQAFTPSGALLGDNRILNPGFEIEDDSGNVKDWETNKHPSFPATAIIRHNKGWHVGGGKSGYGYAITNQAYGSVAPTKRIKLDSTDAYEARVDIRGEIAADASKSQMSFRVLYYDNAGARIKGRIGYDNLDETIQSNNSWNPYKLPMAPPTNAKYASIQLVSYQFSGWVAFDNVQIVKAP